MSLVLAPEATQFPPLPPVTSLDPDRSRHGGQNTGAAGASCVYCRHEIEPGQTFYTLTCDVCTACSDCLLEMHATRGAFQFRCPCTRLVTSHRRRRRGGPEDQLVPYPSDQLHPIDVLRQSGEAAAFANSTQKQEGDAVVVLYRSIFYRDTKGETNQFQTKLDEACQTLSLAGIKDATDTVPPATLDSLGRFFSTLHTWIVQRSVTPHGKCSRSGQTGFATS